MDVEAWDEVFVRTTRRRVNDVVVDVAGWGRWWPGARVDVAGTDRHHLHLRGGLRHPTAQDLVVHVDRVRPRDKGLELHVTGDVEGAGEWFHLDERDGVVVHYLLRGTLTAGNPRRWVAAHRASVRRALTSLKRRLEAGRPPGAEPHPELLRIQAHERAVFAEEVAAHEARIAAGSDPPAPGA